MASLKRRLLKYKIWFKELFRFCPIRTSRIDRENLFLICAHRGSPVNEPENTIPSLERAVREGANSLEIDICLTKDKEAILWHDWNPDELVGFLRERGVEPEVTYKPDFPAPFSGYRNKTSELTLQEMRTHFKYLRKSDSTPVDAHIPTLKEFMIWLTDKPQIKYVFLDIKVPKSEKKLILTILNQLELLIKEFKPSVNFIIETFIPEVQAIAKSNYPDFAYSLDVEIPPGFIFSPKKHSTIKLATKNNNKVALILKPRQITIANWVTFRRLIKYDVRKRKSFNKKNPESKIDFLIGCTINDKREMECLIKSGINGIQTDYPRRLKNLANQYNLKTQ